MFEDNGLRALFGWKVRGHWFRPSLDIEAPVARRHDGTITKSPGPMEDVGGDWAG